MTKHDIAVVGSGMIRFGKYPDISLKVLGGQAVSAALADAGMEPSDIDAAFVANSMNAVLGGQAAVIGQTILRPLGFSNVPVFNIDNACAGSSSALKLAVQAIRSGDAETVLVLGVEKLVTQVKHAAFRAINGAVDPDFLASTGIDPERSSVFVTSVYPERLRAYEARHGLAPETLAEIAVKNRKNAALNPLAQHTTPISREDVLTSRHIVGPLTALMCAPIGDGAAAVVVTSAEKVRKDHRPVWIAASRVGMGSTGGGSIGRTARLAYADAGLTPRDISLAEVHDSISFNELLAYEELGFAEEGRGRAFFETGDALLGGKLPVNPSGGLESRGHPIAATGLGQIHEIVTQLRGDAGERQVRGAKVGLAENAGGFAHDDTGAIAITILQA